MDSLNERQKEAVLYNDAPLAVMSVAGCITGDTEINFYKDGEYQIKTIKNACESYTLSDLENVRVRSYIKGGIDLNNIEDIVYSGKKQVYRLTLKNGMSLKATIDHKILTGDGYIELGDLSWNHQVVCEMSNTGGVYVYSNMSSVEKLVIEGTYDIQCKAPFHNFVANGIVIHNSGKTRTVVTKIGYLVNELEIRPSRIWACSFTNKASDEMRGRLVKIIGGDDSDRLKMGTIHSIAYGILKQGLSSLDPNFKMPRILIYEYKILTHLYKFCKSKNLFSKDAKDYLKQISNLKLDLFRPRDFKIEDKHGDPSRNVNTALYLVYTEYESWLKKNNYMDFQDMLCNCYYMLIDPKYNLFVERLQNRCEYLIIDEAQDTNTVSFKIAYILAEKYKKIAIIGDLRQCIFKFQGARISNIKNYIDVFKPKIIDLNINYRSTQNIVRASNNLISFDRNIIGEPAITNNETGDNITTFVNSCPVDESEKVVELIQKLVSEGEKYEDITILYRVHAQASILEMGFLQHQIPFVTYCDRALFQRKEIKDILSYLKVADDPQILDAVLLKDIANKPNRFIANDAIKVIDDLSFNSDEDIWTLLEQVHSLDIPFRFKNPLSRLYDDLSSLVSLSNNGAKPKDIVEYIFDDMGYEEWALKDSKKASSPDVDASLNLDSFIDIISMYNNLESLMMFVKATIDAQEARKKSVDNNYIKMMSVHRSKGLEFRNVIVIGVCDRLFPFYKSVIDGNEDEERRIMYVAITRPEKRLYLSTIKGRFGRNHVSPSPYIQQLGLNKDI